MKTFQNLIINEIFKFFNKNNLISCKQSGFGSGDSCINRLLSVTHEMYETLDASLKSEEPLSRYI